MRFGFAVLVMLLFVGSAEAEDMGKAEGQASFPANGWAYIGMSPDAPGLRSVFILPLREACEYGVDLERKKAKPGLRMTYTNCQRVALGQPTDDAWWLFSIGTTGRTTPVTTWAGSTDRAMCENFRRDTFAWRYANQRVGQTCQLMNLKLAVATERTAEPADSITATPPFPAQGWGYVLTAAETPGKRALIHFPAKALCETGLHLARQRPSELHPAFTDCRPVIQGGGINSSDWWAFPITAASAPITIWQGSSDEDDCTSNSAEIAAHPESVQASFVGTCQRVTLRMN